MRSELRGASDCVAASALRRGRRHRSRPPRHHRVGIGQSCGSPRLRAPIADPKAQGSRALSGMAPEPVVLDTDTLSELSRGNTIVKARAFAYLAEFGRLTITAVTV